MTATRLAFQAPDHSELVRFVVVTFFHNLKAGHMLKQVGACSDIISRDRIEQLAVQQMVSCTQFGTSKL